MRGSVLARIARTLSDDALVANLNRCAAELDEWASEGFDADNDPALTRERAVRDSLRAEYRRRTGEVI